MPYKHFSRPDGSSCTPCPSGYRSPIVSFSFETQDRDRCIDDEFVCEPDEVRDRNGDCVAVSCLFKGFFLRDKKCKRCNLEFRRSGNKGKRNEFSLGGATKEYMKCPKGTFGLTGRLFNNFLTELRTGPLCICPAFGAMLNGKCLKRCPDGSGKRWLGMWNCLPAQSVDLVPLQRLLIAMVAGIRFLMTTRLSASNPNRICQRTRYSRQGSREVSIEGSLCLNGYESRAPERLACLELCHSIARIANCNLLRP